MIDHYFPCWLRRGAWLSLGLASAASLPAQPDTPPTPPPPPPQEMMMEAPPAPNATPEEALRAAGYFFATRMGLQAGFSEEELALVIEGLRRGASGADEPENFQESIMLAQQIFQERSMAWQQKEMEKMQAEAKGHREEGEKFLADLDAQGSVQKTESGLRYEIQTPGEGKQPSPRDSVVVNYRGTRINGEEFDAGQAAEFRVNQVVPGFSEGIRLLKEGGKARLYLPADLAYGDTPRPGGKIKPGDTLIFDVELLTVKEAPAPAPRPTPPPPPPPGAAPHGDNGDPVPSQLPPSGPPDHVPPPPDRSLTPAD